MGQHETKPPDVYAHHLDNSQKLGFVPIQKKQGSSNDMMYVCLFALSFPSCFSPCFLPVQGKTYHTGENHLFSFCFMAPTQINQSANRSINFPSMSQFFCLF